MRHFILLPFLALVLLPSKINAEEPADSISVELNEIVVQADAERTSPTSVIYTPDSRQKQSATSAIDLLAKMGIPQLTVDIMGTSATTVSGQPITYFIDYLPASEDQLSGMRTKDVKRVEYLEYPSDPRFHGAANVINYIMMQYEYGGYTKLTDSAWITTGLDANYFNAYSKLSYRKMTYDLYMGESYTHNHHNGSVNEETIRLRNNDGEWYDLSRTNKITDSFLLYNNIPVGFRATYATERMQIQNRVKFSFTDNPFSNSSGTLEITPGGGNDYSFSNVSSQVSRYAGWDASYFFSLPKSWSLSIYPQFEYTSTNQNSIYSSSLLENGNVVNNDAKDRSYGVSVYSYVGKMFSPKHQLFLHLKEQWSHNRVRYVHSGADNDFDSNLGIFGVGYTFSLPMIRVRAEGGAVCNYSLTNDKNYFTINPSVSLTANYAPNNKNSVAFSMSYSTYAPDSYLKTPNLIRLDEFLYAVGNPDVKPYNNLYTNLNWSWIPKNASSG